LSSFRRAFAQGCESEWDQVDGRARERRAEISRERLFFCCGQPANGVRRVSAAFSSHLMRSVESLRRSGSGRSGDSAGFGAVFQFDRCQIVIVVWRRLAPGSKASLVERGEV
jgi:hypothetical protein